LDSAANGKLAEQGTTTIEKRNGQVIYSPLPIADSRLPMAYNTMTTPRGGQYQLTLPDGSQVWLNAESSITYPTAFSETERERRVKITGEAYFEVTSDKKRPFIVAINTSADSRLPSADNTSADSRLPTADEKQGFEIEVLGTHFNVNAYKEEPTINTTLIEGSVRIKNLYTTITLKPGQQGQLNPRTEKLAHVVHPDINEVIAWKNGNFYFDNKNLRSILEDFSRWYDVDVVYEGNLKNRTFFGIVKRDKPLSHVLKLLEDNNIRFRIEGKKLIVQSD